MRHPFRLYANDDGDDCVLVCEAPIMKADVNSVLNSVVRWANKFKVREIRALADIPVGGILADSDRQPMILYSDGKTADDGGFIKNINKNNNEDINKNDINSNHLYAPRLVTGVAGGFLAACLSNRITCRGL